MSSWSESISARCRAMHPMIIQDENLDVIWEDSVVGSQGHVFCIGKTSKGNYFYINGDYDTFEKQSLFEPSFHIFFDVKELKIWLLHLKTTNHPKSSEILPIMKFFLV